MSEPNELVKKIEEILKEDSLQYTLSKEALSKTLAEIETLTVERDELKRKLELSEKNLAISKRDDQNKYHEIRKLEQKLVEWEKRGELIESAEKGIIETNIRSEFERKRSDDLKEVLSMFLRNTNYRESIQKTVPVVTNAGIQNQYGGYDGATYAHPEQVTETTEREAE